MKSKGQRKARGLWSATWAGVAAMVVLASTAQAAVVSDTFDANTPSPFWRSIINGTGPSVTQAGGQLEVTIPSSATGTSLLAGFQSRCAVSGDFDARVDYQLVGPKPDVGLFELFSWEFATGSAMGGVARNFQIVTGGDSYGVFKSFGPGFSVPTTDTMGTIRLQRMGSATHGYYESGGMFVDLGQVSFPTTDAMIGIFATDNTLAGSPAMQGAFDNFSLQADGISCPVLNELCGDGVVQSPGEQCDDGNAIAGDGCCDCQLEPLSAAPDVSGNWQVNITCPNSVTITSPVSLTQTAGSGAASLTPAFGCGTFFSDGQIHEILACDMSSQPAQVCGNTFAFYPSQGTATVSPYSSTLGTCNNVSQISARQRLRGTITTDGAGKATLIAGNQGFDFLRLYNASALTQPCFETDGTVCSFEMRPNSTAPSTTVQPQVVEPLTGVSVTLTPCLGSSVRLNVVPETVPSTELPPNFAVVANGPQAVYLSIEPVGCYYAGPGASTVCLSYPDANNDGIVDGYNVNENDLKILHDEGGTFVDRTISRDPVNNVICAAVGGFSQFVLGAGDAPTGVSLCGTAPRTDCRMTTKPKASSIQMKRPTKGSPQLTWNWKGAATTKADFGDPLNTTDYQLCVYDSSAGTPIAAMGTTVPAGSSWQDKPTGFKYSNKAATPDGLFQLQLTQGGDGHAKIVAKGKGPLLHVTALPLLKDPSVTVQLVNSAGTCWSADFSTATKDTATQFKAKSD